MHAYIELLVNPTVTDPVASPQFSPDFSKKRLWDGKFFIRLPLSVRSLVCSCQTYTKIMIYAGYVKVTLEKPQTDWVKLKISPGTGEAKFLLG